MYFNYDDVTPGVKVETKDKCLKRTSGSWNRGAHHGKDAHRERRHSDPADGVLGSFTSAEMADR